MRRLVAPAWRRGFSTAPAAAPSRAGARLAALRLQLQEDDAASAATPPRRRKEHVRHPEWLKVQRPGGEDFQRLKRGMRKSKLATVCEEARCPNIGEC